MILTVQLFN